MCEHRRQRAGFTLVELLMVLLILGILIGLAMPSTEPTIQEQLRGTARILAGDLAYGRSLALSNNSSYRFTFDTANNRYLLAHSGSNSVLNTLPKSPYGFGTASPTQQIVALDDLPRVGIAVRLLGAAIYNGSYQAVTTLEFGPLGQTTASSPTTIWLSAGSGDSARYVSISVDPVTGIAEIGPCVGTPPSVLASPGG